jgi:formylglycine-generating enzyme required for sulfatase activity
VTGAKLGAILAAQSELRLVVLNACGGAQTSMADPFSGLAQALVGCQIPAVIAMRSRITDHAAVAFAEHFYGALGRNLPVDAALADARRAMFSRRDDLEWTTPVLYTRSPDGQLFNFSPESPAMKPQAGREETTSSKWRRVKEVFGKVPWPAWITAAMLSGLGVLYPWKGPHLDPNLSYMAFNPPECPSPPGIPMAFVKVQPGTFFMGEKPEREVTISRPFCMGRFEVTQAQWKKVMGTNISDHRGDAYPAERVLWKDVQEFLARLNARSPGANYRLPRNAQWEYAARAGTVSPYSFDGDPRDLSQYANCKKGSDENRSGTAWVGSFNPNPWGIFDMYGNVAEWVEDDSPNSAAIEQVGTAAFIQPIRHIRRGGGFRSSPASCDSASQSVVQGYRRYSDTGFRLIRDPVNP